MIICLKQWFSTFFSWRHIWKMLTGQCLRTTGLRKEELSIAFLLNPICTNPMRVAVTEMLSRKQIVYKVTPLSNQIVYKVTPLIKIGLQLTFEILEIK